MYFLNHSWCVYLPVVSYHTAALENQVPPGDHDTAPTFLWNLTPDSAQLEFPGNKKKPIDRTSFMVLYVTFSRFRM